MVRRPIRNFPPQCKYAARQLQALNGFRRPRNRKLRLSDVKQMFQQMKSAVVAGGVL
jgi:hypothetical protein